MAYIDRFRQDLAECADAGVLTQEQARRAAAHVAERQDAQRIRGLTWIGLAAGLSPPVGLVLIISHNWERIPALAKMAAFVALLASTGAATLGTKDRGLAVNVPLELVWLFLPLAGIGLYAQIFQLSGDPMKPYLIWLLLSAPLAWYSPRAAAAVVHTAGALAVLWFGTLSTHGVLSLIDPQGAGLVLVCLLLLAAALQSHFRLAPEHRVVAAGAALGWVLAILGTGTPLQVKDSGLIFAAATALSVLWLAVSVALTQSEKPRALPRTAWLAAIYFGTFLWHVRDVPAIHIGETPAGAAFVFTLAAAALAAVFLIPGEALSRDERRVAWARSILAVSIVLPFGALLLPQEVGAACNVLLAAAAVGLMWNGSVEGRVGQINAGVGVLFLLIVTRFVDVFGTLLQGGLAFIAAGGILAGLSYALHQGRRELLQRSRGAA